MSEHFSELAKTFGELQQSHARMIELRTALDDIAHGIGGMVETFP